MQKRSIQVDPHYCSEINNKCSIKLPKKFRDLSIDVPFEKNLAITLDEVLERIVKALAPECLSPLQVNIFRRTWHKQSYRQIARALNHEYGYIKDVGAELWKLLSQVLGVQVTKLNLQQSLTQATRPGNLPTLSRRRIDWGEAVDISQFCGRQTQLDRLNQWLIQQKCRLIAIVGMGGSGKTMLATQLATQLADQFENVVWRSLRQAPPLTELLSELLQVLALGRSPTIRLDGAMRQLLEQLRHQRCLLILDNVEAILSGRELAGTYRPGYEDYGWLFEQFGKGQHQSSILLTSREVPAEVAILEGPNAPVQLLRLEPLSIAEGEKILAAKGLTAQAEQTQALVERYQGNPLALQIVATPLKELFDSNIAAFLAQETLLFEDIRRLLTQQMARLSLLERQVMYWLAINREAVTAAQLQTDLLPSVSQTQLQDALLSLDRRSLIEKIKPIAAKPTALMQVNDVRYTQQPVVMEYVIEQLIERVCQEVGQAQVDCLRSHALLKAQAKDYVRDKQLRLILQPILARLLEAQGGSKNLKQLLLQLLREQQLQAPRQPGYFASNIIHLLRQLETDLSHLDFSNLMIWQADLRLTKAVNWVEFHPTGQVIASSHGDNVLRLWEVQSGDCLHDLSGHSDRIPSVAFSPDGRLLASGSFDQTVRLWDVQTGDFLRTFRTHSRVNSIAFSADGSLLASSGIDRVVRLWEVCTGRCLRAIEPGTAWIPAVAFSPTEQRLANSNQDGTVKLWNANTSDCLLTLEGHSRQAQAIAFDPVDRRLASGSHDCMVKVWDLQTGQCIQTLQGHTRPVVSVCFHPQKNLLASGSFDQTLKLWDVQQGTSISTLQGHTRPISSVAFDPEGCLLVSSSEDGTIRLWDSYSGDCLRIFTVDRPYEGMDISGVTGLTDAQKESLRVLGAIP